MEIMEIILLVVGVAVFVASFLLPVGREEKTVVSNELVKEEIRSLIVEEMEEIKSQVDDTVEEAVNYAMEKTERSLERISNEKIMAVNEYSDTVLTEINKNHQEVMFLYDMLNDKHTSLKNTASEVEKTAKKAKTIAKKTKEVAKEAEEVTRKAGQVLPTFQPLQPERIITSVEEEPEKQKQEEVVEDSNSNNNETILALYKAGNSKVEIAKQLGLGVGEVSLVIDLFKG